MSSARSARFGALLVSALLAACQAGPPADAGGGMEMGGEAAALSPQDRGTIEAASDRFVSAALAGDFQAVADLYAPDAVLMPPNAPEMRGRDAIREYLAGFGSLSELAFTRHEIEGRGDLAYVRGAYRLTTTPAGMTEAVSDTGKYIEIWRRQPDGSWNITADIFNSDVAMPAH